MGEDLVERAHRHHLEPPAQRARQVCEIALVGFRDAHLLDSLAAHEPEEPPGGVDHREPRPAVAEEELVERAIELGLGR